MTTADDNANTQPAPLALLIAAIPPKHLLGALKKHPELAQVVLQGFSARVPSLAQPVVRQRLERELAHHPEVASEFFTLWQRLFADLRARLDAADFDPSPATLRPLRKKHGEAALHYALLHAERDAVRAWAERLEEINADAPPAARAPLFSPEPAEKHVAALAALQQQAADAKQQAHDIARERDALAREVARLEKELAQAAKTAEALRKQLHAEEAHLQREERRTRKAQEEADALRKQLHQLQRQKPSAAPAPAPVAVPEQTSATIAEAIRLLQSLVEASAPVAATPETPAAPPPPRARAAAGPEPSVTLTLGRKKQQVPLTKIRAALVLNDETTVSHIRDSLARQPQQERAVLAELGKYGIPRAVLTGPLRPALVDGSNVANMSPERRAHLAYIEQVRHAAWSEGYFPVLIIVDASLRHQIDRPDDLMAMVERGEIRMAPAGTSADELLIEEAKARDAIIITNDRLAEWPAAKTLEKRHVELDNGAAHLGNFHTSSLWFR